VSQHFLLSKAAKTLSLAQVFSLSNEEAEAMFRKVRWPETEGEPVCPSCGGLNAYDCRRTKGAPRFPLPRLPQGFQHNERDAVRLPQAALARLSRGNRHLLQ
jgi:hypothetical protein